MLGNKRQTLWRWGEEARTSGDRRSIEVRNDHDSGCTYTNSPGQAELLHSANIHQYDLYVYLLST